LCNNYDRLKINRKTGTERFRNEDKLLSFDLLNFWQWSASDLVSNATRGVLAEYIVMRALGIENDHIRDEWAAFDLETSNGIKIEVKSAAYLQSWHQKKLSKISFRTPKTRLWNPDTNKLLPESKRQADVYVFALLAHKDKKTVNPLDVSQWEFYVLPTSIINERKRSQHSITLSTLRKICEKGAVTYFELDKAVKSASKQNG